jgi:calnexin
MNYGPDCGGAYIKLLTHNDKKQITAKNFGSSTPYTIMFGPDYCKPHTDRVHFILRHRNPVNGAFTEHKVVNTTKIRADKMSHVYTLAIWPNNTFIIYVDRVVEFQGFISVCLLRIPFFSINLRCFR